MKARTQVLTALLIVCAGLLLAGCPTRTSIANINRDPGRFVGKEVTIAGRVSSSFGALGSGVFQIDDGTGTMWVFSQNYGVPGNGARVGLPIRRGQLKHLTQRVDSRLQLATGWWWQELVVSRKPRPWLTLQFLSS